MGVCVSVETLQVASRQTQGLTLQGCGRTLVIRTAALLVHVKVRVIHERPAKYKNRPRKRHDQHFFKRLPARAGMHEK